MVKSKYKILIDFTQEIIDDLRLDPIEYFDRVYAIVERYLEELLWKKVK